MTLQHDSSISNRQRDPYLYPTLCATQRCLSTRRQHGPHTHGRDCQHHRAITHRTGTNISQRHEYIHTHDHTLRMGTQSKGHATEEARAYTRMILSNNHTTRKMILPIFTALRPNQQLARACESNQIALTLSTFHEFEMDIYVLYVEIESKSPADGLNSKRDVDAQR